MKEASHAIIPDAYPNTRRTRKTHLAHAAGREGVLQVKVLEHGPRDAIGLLARTGPSQRYRGDRLRKRRQQERGRADV